MAFLLGVPFGMGACSLAFTDDAQVRWFQRLLLVPWLVIFLLFMLLVAVAHEEAACILVLALPLIFAVMLGTITRFDPAERMASSIAVDPTALRQGSTERPALEAGYFRFLDAT